MIIIESRKKAQKTIEKKYPGFLAIDVTSKADEPWIKLSPFYPHGKIPVPFSPGHTSMSVEGIWQGLKVFSGKDVDTSKFFIANMKGLKRTVRLFGKPLGHRKGVTGIEMLDYITARKEIYLVAYEWMLKNKAQEVIQLLKEKAENKDILLLDYTTNDDILNGKKPLSHAALIKQYLEKKYPDITKKHTSHTIKKESRKPRSAKGNKDKGAVKKDHNSSNQLGIFQQNKKT